MQGQERKLRNSTQRPIGISTHPPSLVQMLDGERVYAQIPGKNIRLKIRFGAKLYYTEFLPVDEKETTNNIWEDME